MNYLLVLASLALIAPAAAQEALSFKGLPLGASEADVLKLYPKVVCNGEPQRRTCRVLRDNAAPERITDFNCLAEKEDADACTTVIPAQRLSVAGEAVEWIAFTLHEGRLGNILMQPQTDAFANIARAYIDIYGPPLMDILTPVTTPSGAVLEDRALHWSFPGGSIALRRYSRDGKQSSVHYYSTEAFTRRVDEVEGARQRAAGDL